MSAKTRIWVFHMKELIYTAVFVVLGIFFLLLLIFMFSPDQTAQTSEESPSPYTAGIYTTSLMLGGNPVEIAITVDHSHQRCGDHCLHWIYDPIPRKTGETDEENRLGIFDRRCAFQSL